MLITNVVLFISSAVCSATSVTGTSVVTSTRSRRGVVYVNPNIGKDQDANGGVQTTPRASSLQDISPRSPYRHGSIKASDTPKLSYASPYHSAATSGSHAYGSVPPKRQLPYGFAQQAESHRKNPLASSYFDISSNTYGTATSTERPLDASKLIVSPVSLTKLSASYSPAYDSFHRSEPIELASFADFGYPSYAGIGKLISQDFQQGATSSAARVPMYKTGYPPSKVGDYTYGPGFPSSGSTLLQSSGKIIPHGTKQQDQATVNVNGKKISVPVIQIQSNPDFDGILPVFENQPFLPSYAAEPDLEFNLGPASKFGLTQSRNASPFLSPLSRFQGQVVPIQTAGSNPQFPQYKGASIEVYPVASNLPKAQGSYESLYSQPQLHFGKEHGSRPVNVQQNTVQPSVSTEGILDDAEIINTKNPEPHTPQPDDDDDDDDDDKEQDERYKNPEKKDDRSTENDGAERQSGGKRFKEPPTESDFRPSTSYPFKEYDEKFGKYNAQTDDEDTEDRPYYNYKNYSSNDDDAEDESSSEDRAEHVKSTKPSRDSYEEEDENEEESHKHERHEGDDDESYEVEPKQSKNYGRDFEREFDESYRKRLPKRKYVRTKELPETVNYNNPESSKRQQTDDRPRVKHEESRNHGSQVPHRNRQMPRTDYRDNAAYGTDMSINKSPRVIYEEFFGYKTPGTIGRYAKHAKTEAVAIEKYLPKSPKDSSYLRAGKYRKLKSPKIGGGLAHENNSHLYVSANSWKPGKVPPEETLAGSNGVRQLSDPGDGASFYGTNVVVNGPMRSLTKAEILGDFTGI